MTKIVVSFDKMTNYANSLNTKKEEFNTITTDMKKIVESLNSAWVGVDSEKFRENATNYLNNLKVVENSLADACREVNSQNSLYVERCSKFNSLLGG